MKSDIELLREYKEHLDRGEITQVEFDTIKKSILTKSSAIQMENPSVSTVQSEQEQGDTFNSESADVFQNEPDGNRAGTINNTTAKPRHVEQTAFENQKQSRKEDYSLSETNKYIEKLADGLSIFVVFAFIAGGALTLLGLYKVMVYKEYVGGDAYNLIIRAIHFASCFMLAAAGYISGAVAMVGQKIILANIKPVAQVKEKEKESVKYDEELPMI